MNQKNPLSDAYDHCERIARTHYENFPVASFSLPREQRKHIAAVYAFARTADDFADEPGYTPQERLQKLDEWERLLEQCYQRPSGHPIFLALADTAQRFHIPLELFKNLLTAFRSDVTIYRYETFEELLGYCKNSANPVGRLVLLIAGYHDELLFAHSDHICTALQLTNFWQDISIDSGKDRLYIPLEDIGRFGCKEQEMLAGVFHEKTRRLMQFEIERTEQIYESGKALLTEVHKSLRWELKLTWIGGMQILRKIRAMNYNSIQQRPKLEKIDKVSLLFRSFFM